MYAIVETGGKQYRVAPGDKLKVEKLNAEVGSEVVLDKVLMVTDDSGKATIGTPVVSGARVIATVKAQDKHKKIIVFKYKSKVNYRRKTGHRQPFTQLVIDRIEA